MKKAIKLITALAMVAFTGTALLCNAQSLKVSRIGEREGPNGNGSYVMPSTTVVVDITVRHERIRAGEYARYAQRYLGVIAPLADKDIYSITSAGLQWYDTDTAPAVSLTPVADEVSQRLVHNDPDESFMRVPPDKMSPSVKNPEDAARDAANTIYNIRKRRLDLIMGDIGENVYGEGLKTAIERMDRMENEYLELFLGKQTVTTYTKRFYIVPEKGKTTYVICRLSETGGLLPVDDLSGFPILLELKPRGQASALYSETAGTDPRRKSSAKSAAEAGSEYMVADQVVCRVTDGTTDFVATVIPIYQMGVRTNR